MKRKDDLGPARLVELILQCIAVSLCIMILINMDIEDHRPPVPSSAPCIELPIK
jgi:hypothetical protein